MGNELVNIYIDKLVQEATEGTKTRILLESQLKYTELLNNSLKEENEKLKQEIDKLNKRKSKAVDTANTSDF